MEIYILRHAKAVERGAVGYEDDKRPLTEEGIDEMRTVAKGIAKIVPGFDIILTSPLERALHTAEIVFEALEDSQKPEVCNQLMPGSNTKGLFAYLSKHKDKEKILLVGHEPDLGMIAATLLGTENFIIKFKKGGMCRIDISYMPPTAPGVLVWSAMPKMLRIIGKEKG